MFANPGKLSKKIVGMLIAFFMVAMTAIGLTLLISWQLEGVAAAINDAGSLRMRTYRIGHLMARGVEQKMTTQDLSTILSGELDQFDKVLRDLQLGDPVRPLSPPRNAQVQDQVSIVSQAWGAKVRPLVLNYLSADLKQRDAALDRFDDEIEDFVSSINELVLSMEWSYAHDTNLLRTVQAALVFLAIIGTGILIRFFIRLVITPIGILLVGMRRMTSNDLSVRLPGNSNDELGRLAQGFNQMAEHLQNAYGTLEERVEAETRSLAQRNRELRILYEETAFLTQPANLENICQGFLDRIKTALGADGGAVRLYEADRETLHLMAHEGLSDQFVAIEAELNCGECLCGEVIQTGITATFQTANPPPGMKLRSCIREGFATATAFTILYNKQRLGVYNLYFRRPQALSERDIYLLETLGQHLGVAIENQRLMSRERELAVSEERNLLAQELHDSIAQGLAFLNIQVQLLQDSLRKGRLDEAMQTAGQLREGVQESYDDVRELLVHFRTRVHQSDLDSAIQAALEKFEGQTGINTAFERIGSGSPFGSTDEVQIMHIVQESLSNIRKHARASNVNVMLHRDQGRLTVEVKDDGVGFDTVNEPNVLSDRHVGLKIMRERAHRVGGECRVDSEIGRGTRVTLNLPRETMGAT
ncbi:type IV pili methyl-accepting chemotaxis transducer N-terminal domain-containing protein [Dechloromonas denitrificans]|uniref:type IV pili methyl-accepting chemotaxis transducer N-terminal domain-containing protein n=1 Tax=Dechloromonas denitrificans TaxID=281362 RepID=UPI001CF911A3|nr:type IV pili methyl-accepting chemotaxis transducer N-terminal domain-containing protein [Dechloromonas denitrificans]UCV10862.1 type IV pili methyl-accepting chemotaxis transducer N-terminal domain-containing protein [Dechloromonas denitrificans]